MHSWLAYPRPLKGAHKAEPLDHPTVVWFDPGGTVGWSVIQVHRDALEVPELNILENVTHWAHGQISAHPLEKLSGSSWENKHRQAYVMRKQVGNGFAHDSTAEHHAVREMIALVNTWPGCAVGVESFVVRRYDQSSEFLSPVRLIAAFEYACWMLGIHVFRQSPSDAKTVATDERLKLWGYYKRDGEEHGRDADRHSITFMRSCKDMSKGRARRELAWPAIYGDG